MKVRNTFIIFIVSGFWHGANWTFIVWGALNAIYFLPLLLLKRNRKNTGHVVAENRLFPNIKEIFQVGSTFLLTVLAWIFFRAENVSHAWEIINEIFSFSLLLPIKVLTINQLVKIISLIAFFLVLEWKGRSKEFAIEYIGERPFLLRYSIYGVIVFSIMLFGNFKENQFIYFQF